MKKMKIGVFIAILFLIGIFAVSISSGNFFFTTKYHKTAIEAYNAESTFDAVYGDTTASKQIGIAELDSETVIFLGELNEKCFVVDIMATKDGRYASKGPRCFYDLKEQSDGLYKNQTETSSGQISWSILYSKSETEKLTNVKSLKTYNTSDGDSIYLAIFNN